MIDEQDAQIFKSHHNYARNKRKFTQYLSMQKYGNLHQLFAHMQLFYVTFFS